MEFADHSERLGVALLAKRRETGVLSGLREVTGFRMLGSANGIYELQSAFSI